MAPSTPNEMDWRFLLCCLKYTQGKPDFEAVAKELGYKDKMTAYQKHWGIMKKHGVTGNSGKGRKPANRVTTPAAGTKRGRSTKETKKVDERDEEDDEDLSLIKGEVDYEAADNFESPIKKAKIEQVASEDETDELKQYV